MAKGSKAMDDNRPATAEEVLTEHENAKDLYRPAMTKNEEIQKLIENTYIVPRDIADDGNARVSQIVRARAIIEKFRQMLQVDTLEFSVLPMAGGDSEKKFTTKLERVIRGMDRRIKYESKRDYDRDAAFWYIFRGQAIYIPQFKPDYKGKSKFPIRVYTPDPNSVFPVIGDDDCLYYTQEVDYYGRELCRILESGDYEVSWLKGDDDYKNKVYRCVKYADDTYHAMVCVAKDATEGGKLIYSKKHEYGFTPITIGRCMDTPLASSEWAYSSVIAPVVDSLKQVYILMSKIATGVNLYYYPLILYISQEGRPIVWNPAVNTGADLVHIMPGSDLKVINPTPNAQIINQALSFHLGDISLMTLPDVSFGESPQNLESGFAIAQVISAVSGAVKDKLPQLEQAAGDCRGQMLRIVEQFSRGSGLDFSVPVNLED